MYTREIYKRMFDAINEVLASTDSTSFDYTNINSTTLSKFPGSTTITYGRDYGVTITATTGRLFILPSTYYTAYTEPTSSNAYRVDEGDVVTLRVPYTLSIKGDSTTAKYKAAIWRDE